MPLYIRDSEVDALAVELQGLTGANKDGSGAARVDE
jgi:hypothetical protein